VLQAGYEPPVITVSGLGEHSGRPQEAQFGFSLGALADQAERFLKPYKRRGPQPPLEAFLVVSVYVCVV
jgi:hypothetical protein